MDRFTRLSLAASLLLMLGGCGSLPDMPDIDPTEWFNVDFLNNKKPLPGVRKPVFPDGVPGVTQGVPPDLVQGYKPQPDPTAAEAQPQPNAAGQEQAAVEEPTPEPPKPKAKPKPKPKRKVAAKPAPVVEEPERAPTAVTVRRSSTPQPAAVQQQSGGVQWPAPPGPQTSAPSAPQPSGPGAVQWPDPPAQH